MPKRITRTAAAGPLSTRDSIQNFAARVGLGADNLLSQSHYTPNFTSRNRYMLDAIYRSSWIAGQVVDAPATDMTREGVTLKGEIEPGDIEVLEREMTKLRVWKSMCDTLKWSRLYGGAVGYLMIDGQRPDTPLRMDSIGKGQFKGLLPLDRWMLQPIFDEWITDYGPDYGRPKVYRTIADNMGMRSMRIHYSRVVRLEGVELPYYQRLAENGWGQSVIERLIDRLIAYDSTTVGAAQLVYKAHLRTYSVAKLRELISTGGKMYDALIAQVNLIRGMQSNEGLSLIDAEDKLEAEAYTFAGLDAILQNFGEQISGAARIPLVRLFGQSPAGLNSSGESDIRNYYDSISADQEDQLLNPITTVYEIGFRSTFGRPPPGDFAIEFNPLWQLSDVERATAAGTLTTAITAAHDSGIVDRATALRELRQSARATGVWTNIDDDQIKEAEEEPPPLPEGMPGNAAIDPETGLPITPAAGSRGEDVIGNGAGDPNETNPADPSTNNQGKTAVPPPTE